MTRIVSVWLPHWPLERLRRHSPGAVPDDKPFALVESGAHGLMITAVNPCAARQGLHPGLSLADARAAVPDLQSHPADPLRDAAALERLALWLGRYGPARNADGADGIWIDITGVAHLFGGEPRLLDDLVCRLSRFGVTAKAGLAETYGAAHALARFATVTKASAIAPPGETDAILTPLPVDALRLSPETVHLLKRLGLGSIGHLIQLPRVALERRFSSTASSRSKDAASARLASAVLTRLDQALGHTAEPRAGFGEAPVLCVRRLWSEPLLSSDVLMEDIAALARDLEQALKAVGLGARRVALALYRADGTVARAAAGLSRPSAEAAHIMQLLREKLAGIDAGFGIDVAVLEATEAEPKDAEQTALGRAGPPPENAIAELTDRLTNRIGPGNVYRLDPRASHLPEEAEVRRPLTLTKAGDVLPFQKDLYGRSRERPLLLLTPPERITVMAEVPDGPPLRFTWRRVLHHVVKATGPERIGPEWWRDLGTSDQGGEDGETFVSLPHRTRDYYIAETTDGGRFWIFREGLYDAPGEGQPPRWFVHGLF